MTNLERRVVAVQRRLWLAGFVRALPWSAAAAFAAAAVVIVVGKYQPSWPAWSTVLGAATGLTFVGAVVRAWAVRPAPLEAAVELDKRAGLQERISSALALEQESTDAADVERRAIVEAVRTDAERAAAGVDARRTFPVAWPKREAWPVVPAAIAVGLALWFTPQIPTTPAGEQAEAAITAVVQEQAKQLADKLEQRRREAELMKLAEAQRLLDKLRDEARQLQSADKVDKKDALLKLSDMAGELAERRKDVEAAEQLKKELSRLRSKKKGPADQFAESLSKGDYRAAAEQLQQLRKELESKQLDSETKQQLADQLQQLQKQLEEMADARQQMQKDLEQKAHEAAQNAKDNGGSSQERDGERNDGAGNDSDRANGGSNGPGDQAALAEQLSKLAAGNTRMDALKQAFEQAAEGLKNSGGEGEQSLDALQRQLDQLSQMAGENDLLQRGLDDLAECKSRIAQGDPIDGGSEGQGEGEQGDAQGKQGLAQGGGNQGGNPGGQRRQENAPGGGLMPGRGVGSGLAEDGVAVGGGGFDSRVRGQVGAGAMRVVGPADGPNAKGKVLDTIRKQADAVAAGGEAQKLENQPLDRSRREQKKQYFDALRQP